MTLNPGPRSAGQRSITAVTDRRCPLLEQQRKTCALSEYFAFWTQTFGKPAINPTGPPHLPVACLPFGPQTGHAQRRTKSSGGLAVGRRPRGQILWENPCLLRPCGSVTCGVFRIPQLPSHLRYPQGKRDGQKQGSKER